MIHWKNSFDLYGVRQFLAVLVAGPIAWIAAQALSSSPPDAWAEWAPDAKQSLRLCRSGSLGIGLAAWVWLVHLPFRQRFRVARVAGVTSFGLVAAPGIWQLLNAANVAGDLTSSELGIVASHATRICLLPLGVGAAVASVPLIIEWVTSRPIFRRLFVRGHAGGFAGPFGLRRYSGSPPKRENGGPLLTDGIPVGRTCSGDAYAGGKIVTIDNSAHVKLVSMPGGGKFLLLMCSLCTGIYSKIFISTKPEGADQAAGFSMDPALLPPPVGKPQSGPYGADLRPLTRVTHHLANSRSYILSPGNDSVGVSGTHNLQSDIDPLSEDAQVQILSIAGASFPDRSKIGTDTWFAECAKGWIAAVWLFLRLHERNPAHWWISYAFERAMGRDPGTGICSSQVLSNLVEAMLKCTHPIHGAFIATKAAEILRLGDRQFGALFSEISTYCNWAFQPAFRRQLERPSDFSYHDMGDDLNPISVYIVPLRGFEGLRVSLPWLRAHTALSLSILSKRRARPRVPTCVFADEARQFLAGIPDFSLSLTLLREARVRLISAWQSEPSIELSLGKDTAAELDATSASIYFGIDSLETAERISRRLGEVRLRNRELVPVKTPPEILRELRIDSPLCYLMGGGLPSMRLRRLSYKSVSTKDGLILPGLGIEGQYDELSQFSYGGRP